MNTLDTLAYVLAEQRALVSDKELTADHYWALCKSEYRKAVRVQIESLTIAPEILQEGVAVLAKRKRQMYPKSRAAAVKLTHAEEIIEPIEAMLNAILAEG